MKNLINILLIIAIIFLGWQFINLYIKNAALQKSSDKLEADILNLKIENKNLDSDINYYANPENQEKELKSNMKENK